MAMPFAETTRLFFAEATPYVVCVADGAELVQCTDPHNGGSFINFATLVVTNSAGVAGNLVFALHGGAAPYTNLPLVAASMQTGPTNRAFAASDLAISNVSSCAAISFNDLNGNGQCDASERCVTNYFNISPGENTLRVSLASNFFDNDGDSIPDIWEYVHGLSHTNRYDASADFDGDGLVNLHEYWADCNPAIYDGTNTAIYAAIQSIDNRLTTSNSVGRMAYYSSVSPSAVVVNTNCWAATIPLGSQSPYNATGLRKRAGTLISDMHIVFAHHFPIGNGAKVYFCGSDGSVITNTLLGSRQVVQGNYNYDLRVGILSDSVNTNLVPIAKILPDDYEEYLGIGRALPAVILNQTDECLVFEVSSLLNRSSQVLAEVQASRCLTGIRSVFSKKIQDGDSGNPAYMIVDDEPILLYTLHRAFSGSANSGFDGCAGPSIQRYNAELQQSMNVLSDNYGKSRRTLTYFDLSRFVKLTNWR